VELTGSSPRSQQQIASVCIQPQSVHPLISTLVLSCHVGGYDLLRVGRSGGRIPVGPWFCALVQTRAGAHSGSCTMGTGSSPRGVKRPRLGVDHPRLSSAEVEKSVKVYLYSPSVPSWYVIGWTSPLSSCRLSLGVRRNCFSSGVQSDICVHFSLFPRLLRHLPSEHRRKLRIRKFLLIHFSVLIC
jgi:hypothetical protein